MVWKRKKKCIEYCFSAEFFSKQRKKEVPAKDAELAGNAGTASNEEAGKNEERENQLFDEPEFENKDFENEEPSENQIEAGEGDIIIGIRVTGYSDIHSNGEFRIPEKDDKGNIISYIASNAFNLLDSITVIDKGTGYSYEAIMKRHKFDSITHITVGKNITELEPRAFANCLTLKEVVFEGEIKMLPIECMAGCPNLEKVIFKNNKNKPVILGYNWNKNCANEIKFEYK